MSMEELIQAMMGGQAAPRRPASQAAAGDPLTDILNSILGGQAGAAMPSQPGEPAPQVGGAGDLSGLLEGILGGAAGSGTPGQRSRSAPQIGGAGDLGGLLEAILGGGAGMGMPGAQPAAGVPSGGLMDILGAILGGGGGGGLDSALTPLIAGLADKLGLPPQIAQMVVAFVLGKLMTGQRGAAVPAPAPSRRSGSASRRRAQPAQPAQPAGLDLDSLLERMNSSQGVDPAYLQSTGMVQELAQQTGLDQQTATQSLQEVFGMLGSRSQAQAMQPPAQPRQEGGLDNLLEKW
jgi:hypothetical protein